MSQMCQYGNCQRWDTGTGEGGIGVTGSGWKSRFCCWAHAALWTMRKVVMVERGVNPEIAEAFAKAADELEKVTDKVMKGTKQ